MVAATSGTVTESIAVGTGTLTAGSISIPGSSNSGRICQVTVSTGTITVNGNITFSGTAAQAKLTFTGSGILNTSGNISASTTGTFTASTGTVNFKGTTPQTIPGFTYNAVQVNNPAGANLTGATTMASLTIGNNTANSIFNDAGYTISTATSLTISNASNYNINASAWPWGSATLNSGTTVVYGAASGSQTISTTPTYANLTLSGAATKSTSATGNLNAQGNFTYGGGALTITTSPTYFNLGGNFSTTANITSVSRLVLTLNGSGAQSVSYGATTLALYGLSVNKSAGTATLNSSITVSSSGNLTVTGGTLDLSTFTANRALSGGILSVASGATLRIGGTNSFPSLYSTYTLTGSTVEYYGTQTISTTPSYYQLIFSGAGTKTISAGTLTVTGNWTVGSNTSLSVPATISGNLTIGSGTLTQGTGAINIAGNWINNSAFTAGSGGVVCNGSAVQTLDGTAVTTFNNLTISNSAGVSLANNIIVNGTLTLTSGKITTGSNTLIISSTGSVSGGSSTNYIIGNLQKNLATGAPSRTFEVGTASNYNPVSVTFSNVTTSGNLTINATAGQHPSISSSSINSTKDINVYWTLANSGIVSDNYTATFTFTSGDNPNSANTSNFIAGQFISGWSYPTVGTKTSTSTQVTGLTSYGDIVLGEPITFTLTYTAGAGGTISGTTPQTVTKGNSGTAVTAVPNTGYHFVQWSDSSTNNPRTDSNVTADLSVTASFAINTFTINASAGSSGTISPSGNVTVNYGNSQGFTITPNTGYHVNDVSVNGSSVGAVSSYTFTNVTGNATIAATFAINSYSINATAGTGGTISPSGIVSVNYGGSQTFNITANTGYSISDVSVNGSSVGAVPSYTFTNVTGNATIAASFTINSYSINATAGTGGTISPSGIVSVNYGDNQTFNISPNNGYSISDVSVNGSSVGAVPSYTFTNVTGNATIAATFAINGYSINATAGTGGTISPSGIVSVNYGDNQTFNISPNTGYSISDVSVNGSSVGAVPSYTFTNVTGNATIAATFAINGYSINATAGTGGTISPSGIVSVNYGDNQTFNISPNTGYSISDVVVDSLSQGAITNYSFTSVSANHTISASFSINTFTLTYTAGTNGSISGNATQTVNYGDSGTAVTAVPDTGYHFVQWSDSSTNNPRTDTNVSANISVTATFDINAYTLNYAAGSNGSVSGNTSQTVTYNGNGTAVTAIPASGYHFVQWSDSSTDNPRTDTNVSANISVTASFAANGSHTITASCNAGGTITPSGAVSVNDSGNQSFTIAPDVGHFLYDVQVDGVSQGAITSYSFTNVTADHTISATFDTVTYIITASAGAGGSISPSGNVTVNQGDEQAFTISAGAGQSIANVLVDGSSVGPVTDYTFTNVTSTHTIAASFNAVMHTITASGDTGGTISPPGTVSVIDGGSQAYSFTANSGYYVGDVVIDGVSQGAITNYNFTNVTASHTMYITFYTTSVGTTSGSTSVPAGVPNFVVDALSTAQTTITVNATAPVTIDVIQYTGNPHPEAPLPADAVPKYNDIIVSDHNAITWPLHVEIHYTDAEVSSLVESSLKMYYFQGSSWHLCSSTGVDTANNIVWANMTAAEVLGSPLMMGGNPMGGGGGPTVGGEVYQINKLLVLLPWLGILAGILLAGSGTTYLIFKRRRIN